MTSAIVLMRSVGGECNQKIDTKGLRCGEGYNFWSENHGNQSRARLSADVTISIICTAHLATSCNLFPVHQRSNRGECIPTHRDVNGAHMCTPPRIQRYGMCIMYIRVHITLAIFGIISNVRIALNGKRNWHEFRHLSSAVSPSR